MLGSATPEPKPLFVRAWERDVGLKFSGTQLAHLYQLTHSSSLNSTVQKMNYKILSSWYRMLSDLAHIYPATPNVCWRGCGHKGTLLHFWWKCLAIESF